MAGLSQDLALVLIAAFLILSIFASKASVKLGIPALILFIAIGMFAGSDGLGGIDFTDVGLTKTIGTIALGFILFAGGLDTNWVHIKPVIKRGLALSTIGVFLSTALVGWFADQFLGFTLMEGLLLGAVVSSTDAAAVFGVLRTGNTVIKHRITPLLEFESGTNDPLAVFLTIGLTSLLKDPQREMVYLLPDLFKQMPIGLAVGYACGLAAVWLINHLRLEYDGLYPVVSIAMVCMTFGGAHLLGGNEFLAVYVSGLVMSSRNFLHKIAIVQFHDGIAWLLQIVMFFALGLLVFPSQLLPIAGPGLLLAAFLMFVSRPASVFVALSLARMSKRSKFFVAWAGLRGAVPIILATFPLLAGVPKAQTIFNLVFFVVLTSVLVQGTTLRLAAKWLGVIATRPEGIDAKPAGRADLMHIVLPPNSPAVGKQVVELGLPRTALLVLLQREGQDYIPRGATVLETGDTVLIATRKQDHDELRALFEGTPTEGYAPSEHSAVR